MWQISHGRLEMKKMDMNKNVEILWDDTVMVISGTISGFVTAVFMIISIITAAFAVVMITKDVPGAEVVGGILLLLTLAASLLGVKGFGLVDYVIPAGPALIRVSATIPWYLWHYVRFSFLTLKLRPSFRKQFRAAEMATLYVLARTFVKYKDSQKAERGGKYLLTHLAKLRLGFLSAEELFSTLSGMKTQFKNRKDPRSYSFESQSSGAFGPFEDILVLFWDYGKEELRYSLVDGLL